jgi:hypothetical protein
MWLMYVCVCVCVCVCLISFHSFLARFQKTSYEFSNQTSRGMLSPRGNRFVNHVYLSSPVQCIFIAVIHSYSLKGLHTPTLNERIPKRQLYNGTNNMNKHTTI